MSASPTMIGATDGPAVTGQHSDDAAESAGRPALLDYLRMVASVPCLQDAQADAGLAYPSQHVEVVDDQSAPPWHYCPLPTPDMPVRLRAAVCGQWCDRLDPGERSRGVSAPHLVTCPDCLAEIRDADRGAPDHLRAAPSEILEVRRAE